MRSVHWALFFALALAGGCGSSSSDDAGGSGGSGGGSSGHRTPASCETNIASDAPAIFTRYFRCVTITTTQDSVTIQTDDLPPHPTNYYPTDDVDRVSFDTSRGAQYHANPNTLVKKNIHVTIPLAPVEKGLTVDAGMVDGVVGTSAEEFPMGPAGVALDSVALFNPLAAPGDDIEQEKYTFDAYDAHPAPDGTYHYHTVSPGPLEVLVLSGLDTSSTPGSGQAELFGIMCDGTLVLGCNELDGAAPGSGLDAQGGHLHDVVDPDGTVLAAGRYHVHVCPSSATGRAFTPEIQYYTSCQL
jgi:YHYH protein